MRESCKDDRGSRPFFETKSVTDGKQQTFLLHFTRMLSARISSWRVCSAWFEGPFQIFTLMLSIRVRNWCVCSACPSVPDAYAQQAHQFLTRMLRVCISPWCVCSACCFEGTALLNIILSICIRNSAAPNEPLNFCLNFFILTPKLLLLFKMFIGSKRHFTLFF